jgi:hypothetical protein
MDADGDKRLSRLFRKQMHFSAAVYPHLSLEIERIDIDYPFHRGRAIDHFDFRH